MRTCEAEDQGGYGGCKGVPTYRTKDEPRHYYCADHLWNRHVWRPVAELEPIDPATTNMAADILRLELKRNLQIKNTPSGQSLGFWLTEQRDHLQEALKALEAENQLPQ